jgi:hypothetical protein
MDARESAIRLATSSGFVINRLLLLSTGGVMFLFFPFSLLTFLNIEWREVDESMDET